MTTTYTIQNLETGPAIGIFSGIFLVYAVTGIAVPLKLDFTTAYYWVWIIVWTAMSCAIGYYAIKKLALRELVVSLTAESLAVQAAGLPEQIVPLQQIVSYSYYKNGEDGRFRLRLHSGGKIELCHSATFCPADDFHTFAADFERQQTMAVVPEEKPTVSGEVGRNIQREKTFFEKPLATIIGWFIVVGLCYFTYHLLQHGLKDGKWGAVCMAYANGLAYLGTWWNARRARG
ncbi:hypothetical protein [Hymenobacter sediminicola]|uniref:Uncharacterized protein n=1 Tax=Hymenobacter sediminicola TaxID=2761579 RepID=A0A7G7WBM0_9BACT|nr:hypothetical protein [Hymenobacter sediminicola]QNH63763.1 hypothetical protein H4317_08210 [Hymenobacter sediminicola]